MINSQAPCTELNNSKQAQENTFTTSLVDEQAHAKKAHVNYQAGTAITSSYVDSHSIGIFEPYRWLLLAFNDFYRAPGLSLFWGGLFSLIPAVMLYVVYNTSNWLYVFPAAMAFTIIGPLLATSLYDVAWEIEKGNTPTLSHSTKTLFRNPVGEWGFTCLLLLLMLAWMRLAGLIYVLYPSYSNPSLDDLSAFLTLGFLTGASMTSIAFAISAFTPQILLERRIDVMTAIVSSVNAVRKNTLPMLFWAAIIFGLVLIGFLSQGIAFIVIMPILSYASWHGYIAVMKTKQERGYE